VSEDLEAGVVASAVGIEDGKPPVAEDLLEVLHAERLAGAPAAEDEKMIGDAGLLVAQQAVDAAVRAHAVDDVAPVVKPLHHLADDFHVVLEIGVDADDRVAFRREETRDQRILVPSIPRQLDATDLRVGTRELLDQVPGVVAAPVVDEVDPARSADESCPGEPLEQAEQAARRFGQHRLLVVAGGHDGELREHASEVPSGQKVQRRLAKKFQNSTATVAATWAAR